MLGEPELRHALTGVGLVRVPGPFHRFIELFHLAESLRAGRFPQVLTPIGARLVGGRFTPPGRFDTLYVADTAETALTEAEEQVRRPGVVDVVPARPYVHIAIKGALTRVLDLTDTRVLSALVIEPAQLREPWKKAQAAGAVTPTQALGHAAWESGRIEALAYWSTRRAGHRCLAIFPDRLARPSWLEIADTTGQLRERLPPG